MTKELTLDKLKVKIDINLALSCSVLLDVEGEILR